ncbi:MAG: hypothetical protein FJX76_07830 [Armatimonadetes bacterium]|nr:hypothetical protein [Armatimonadota bacterium]
MNPRRGSTLAEVLAAAAIFMVFTTALSATLTLAMRFWRMGGDDVNLQASLRRGLQTMRSELGQAVVYQDITSSATPSAVLTPATGSTVITEVAFTEPADPNSPSLLITGSGSSSTYQKVSYYPSGNVLYRKVSTLAGGNPKTDAIMTLPSGTSLSMTATGLTANCVQVTLTAKATNAQYSVSTAIYATGE